MKPAGTWCDPGPAIIPYGRFFWTWHYLVGAIKCWLYRGHDWRRERALVKCSRCGLHILIVGEDRWTARIHDVSFRKFGVSYKRIY